MKSAPSNQSRETGLANYANAMVGTGYSFDKRNSTPATGPYNRDVLLQKFRGSVFIAAGAIAKKIASVPIKCFREKYNMKSGTVEKQMLRPSHPLVELLENPNEFDTPFDVHYLTTAWRLLTGNAYIWKIRNGLETMGTGAQLFPMSPQWIDAIPDSNEFIGGYRLRTRFFGVENKEIDRKDMIHIKEPNVDQSGNNRFYGFPVTMAVENTIELENEMFARLRHTFNNHARPGLVFSTDRNMQKPQLNQMLYEIWSQHRAAEHSGLPMIVHSGMKLLAGMNDKERELDYQGSLEATLKFTAAVFGVPLAVVGLVADQNRANAEAALYTFGENTLNPYLVHYSQILTRGLAWDFGRDIKIQVGPFEVKDLAAIKEMMEMMWRSGSITPNEIRAEAMSMQPFKKGGNVPVLPAGSAIAEFGNAEGPQPGIAMQPDMAGQVVNPGNKPGVSGGIPVSSPSRTAKPTAKAGRAIFRGSL